MNMRDKAMELTKSSLRTSTPLETVIGISQQSTEIESEGFNDEKLSDLNDAISELKRVIYSFSAVTDRVEAEKRELANLMKQIAKQKLEVGEMLSELNGMIKYFPTLAAESIQTSVGATSGQLQSSLNKMVNGIGQAVSRVFRNEIAAIKDASNNVSKSANHMIIAKKYYGWEFIIINFITSMSGALLASLLVIKKLA